MSFGGSPVSQSACLSSSFGTSEFLALLLLWVGGCMLLLQPSMQYCWCMLQELTLELSGSVTFSGCGWRKAPKKIDWSSLCNLHCKYRIHSIPGPLPQWTAVQTLKPIKTTINNKLISTGYCFPYRVHILWIITWCAMSRSLCRIKWERVLSDWGVTQWWAHGQCFRLWGECCNANFIQEF